MRISKTNIIYYPPLNYSGYLPEALASIDMMRMTSTTGISELSTV
jgi:hypothetical protein